MGVWFLQVVQSLKTKAGKCNIKMYFTHYVIHFVNNIFKINLCNTIVEKNSKLFTIILHNIIRTHRCIIILGVTYISRFDNKQ